MERPRYAHIVRKSQLAIEYAYRLRERHPNLSVLWIHASTATRFQQGYQDIADAAGLAPQESKQKALQSVQRWLADPEHGPWLMVLDNVDDDDIFFAGDADHPPLETLLPQSAHGSILVTSRDRVAAQNLVQDYGRVTQIDSMSEQEALALLGTRLSVEAIDDATALVQELDLIPLAITHAAAYIQSRPRFTIAKYLDIFRTSLQHQRKLLDWHGAKDARRDYSNRDPVLVSWQVTFDQIRETSPAASDLLALMSNFDRSEIPADLLRSGDDVLEFEDALAPLMSYSLTHEHTGQDRFEMHRLVQLATRGWLEIHGEHDRWKGTA